MYFPAARFIPFIQLDLCVLEHVNAPSLQQHGPKLVSVATENLEQNNALAVEFTTLLEEVYLDCGHNREAVRCIYFELTGKLCNTRIQEFLDVHRQLAAKKDGGTSTLSGQNLRDKLHCIIISHKTKIIISFYILLLLLLLPCLLSFFFSSGAMGIVKS